MKTFKHLLIELNACEEALEWAEDKTIEEVIQECNRGDWLLWLAQKIDIGLKPLTLAKGHCANTVRDLMEDERSIKAVDTAIAFGEGKVSIDELNIVAYTAASAASATSAAYYATYYAASAATSAACYATYYAAYSAASAACAVSSAYSTASTAYYAACVIIDNPFTYNVSAEIKNKKQTADICRKYIGHLIINKVNELIK